MPIDQPVSVLVSPLDWGLGHATRCIPIINQLIALGVQVILAANGPQKQLLTEAFPDLLILEIPDYAIRYKKGLFLKWGLIFQIPSILRQIQKENQWLNLIRQKHSFSIVISDNRYGLYHKDLFCIFITHQLQIKSGVHSKSFQTSWIDRNIMKWNYRFISKFNECWVPDFEHAVTVGGELSHPDKLPAVPVKYIGILSRFKQVTRELNKNRLLILISGPEPQRSVFEKMLLTQLSGTTRQTLILRGLPEDHAHIPYAGENVKILNHMAASELNDAIVTAEYVIARSGYSTIMDLMTLKKKAILIPTPGQTEQEYLAAYLHEKKWMFSVNQKNFQMERVLSAFEKATLHLPDLPDSHLKDKLEELINL